MLVLSRKVSERIVIGLGGETVTIELLKIVGKRARIGVIAPLCIAVHREELREKIEANGAPAADPGVTATCKSVA